MKWLHAKSYLQLQLSYKDICIFLSVAIFKSRLLKMAATVMTAEFGTIYYYFSLEEYSEACLCSFFEQTLKLIGNHVNRDILI